MTDVSSPPEYASTTFLISCSDTAHLFLSGEEFPDLPDRGALEAALRHRNEHRVFPGQRPDDLRDPRPINFHRDREAAPFGDCGEV
jgi:hypothetical protein